MTSINYFFNKLKREMEEGREGREQVKGSGDGGGNGGSRDNEMSEILHMLEDRLVEHDNNRQKVQS